MDSTTDQLYHIHGIDSRAHLDSFFSGKGDMGFGDFSLRFPMANLYYQLSGGQIKGYLLIDISFGSLVHHLYFACEYFKEIVVLKFNEKCIMEMNKWLHDHTGAYDWTHTSAMATELEGKRQQLQEKEMCLKSSIKHILKCDFGQENITTPVVLPLADCIISALILESISKSEDEYVRNLEKILKLLKPGGHLLLFGVLGNTYVVIGEKRIHRLKCEESFVKNALSKLGLVIDYCAVQRRHHVNDLTDCSAVLFIAARKGE